MAKILDKSKIEYGHFLVRFARIIDKIGPFHSYTDCNAYGVFNIKRYQEDDEMPATSYKIRLQPVTGQSESFEDRAWYASDILINPYDGKEYFWIFDNKDEALAFAEKMNNNL